MGRGKWSNEKHELETLLLAKIHSLTASSNVIPYEPSTNVYTSMLWLSWLVRSAS